eukprot:m.96455 g.96455  ORF g.96455 m.96455 type:complete len:248 (+) comp15191_c1_seq3:149-892(+)
MSLLLGWRAVAQSLVRGAVGTTAGQAVGAVCRNGSVRHCVGKRWLSATAGCSGPAVAELKFASHGGTGADDLGGPIVFCHGLFGRGKNFNTVSRQIAERTGRKVYLLDLRNHGSSPHLPSVSYPDQAADLRQFAENEGLENMVLVGHSMGGKVAMAFALQHPELVSKLCVVDIAPIPYTYTFDNITTVAQAMKQVPLDKVANRLQVQQHLARHGIETPSLQGFVMQNLIIPKVTGQGLAPHRHCVVG